MKKAKADLRAAARPVVLLLLPLASLLLCILAEQGGFRYASWEGVALGYLLYAALFFLLLGLSGRAWVPWLLGLIPLLLNTVSHYKLLINGSVLQLADLRLAGQFGEIAAFAAPQLRLSFWTVAAPTVYLLLLALLIGKARFFRAGKGLRAIGAGLGACVLLLPALLPLSRSVDERAGKGAEALLRLSAAYRADRLSGAADGTVLDRVEKEAETPAPVPTAEPDTPTVIFLMSESFFDLSRLPNVTFAQDPQPCYHELTERCLHGRFYSNTYAGGTGYVEMEVLTGLCSAFLRESDDLTALPQERYTALPCITDVFTKYGYRKVFVHSYNDKLYHRRQVYPALGFDGLFFEGDFPPGAETKAGILTDMALTEELIYLYEAREDASPLLFYAISMENHQPYSPGRYGEDNTLELESERLSEEELESLRTYAYAARDADLALKKLTDYFSGVEEKVMLVFWGDHMPNLSTGDGTLYETLGMVSSSVTGEWTTQELAEMLATDYLIWTNYDLGAAPEGRAESSTMLGFHTLRLLGLSLSDYYLWLEKTVDPVYLLCRSRFYADPDGGVYGEIPPAYGEVMEEYAAVVRDIAYGEGSVFAHCREEASD